MRKTITRFGVGLVLAAAVASIAYANSALQLRESYGVKYVKHVNYNSETSAKTWLLLRNTVIGDARVQIKFAARALDGSTVSGGTFIDLRSLEARSLWLSHSKPITDLNFLQLIAQPRQNNHCVYQPC
jgi:hypothetical protein